MQLTGASGLKETSDSAHAGQSPQLMRGPLDSNEEISMGRSRLAAGLLLASVVAVLIHWLCLFIMFSTQDVSAQNMESTLGSAGHSLFFFAFFGVPLALLVSG